MKGQGIANHVKSGDSDWRTYVIEVSPKVVKIGRSIHPMQRLREHQSMVVEPLVMLRLLYGDHEADLHARFRADKMFAAQRELYWFSDNIKAWLNQPHPDDMLGCPEIVGDGYTSPLVRDHLPGWTGDDLVNFMAKGRGIELREEGYRQGLLFDAGEPVANTKCAKDANKVLPLTQEQEVELQELEGCGVNWDAVFRGDVDYLRKILKGTA